MKLYDIQEPGEIKDATVVSDIIVGIDLGTTNSLIAISHNGKVEVIKDEAGNTIIPSIVTYGKEISVGAHSTNDGMTISSIKRLLGKSKDDFINKTHLKINQHSSGIIKLSVGEREVTPVEVSAEILKHLVQIAEKQLDKSITKVVITVPAYFDEGARQATKDAAKIAGLEVVRLLSEPTAAAIAYGFENKPEGTYAVYDLGGGTFDISILRMQEGLLQVIAAGGDTLLGGDDIDQAIAEHLKLDINHQNLLLARKAKEFLTENEVWNDNNLTLTREQLNSIALPFVNKSINILKNTLKSAELKTKDIDEIILVGGSTRLPLIKQKLEEYFGKAPLDSINPDESVVIGAAIQAEGLMSGSDTLLLEVTPLSLGIEVANQIVEKIIYSNTAIPTAKMQMFATQKDGQTGFVIHILQGEGDTVSGCRSLAKFELKGLPPLPAGEVKLEINFQIDADGLLVVAAKELSSGNITEVLVKPSYGLTEQELIRLIQGNS